MLTTDSIWTRLRLDTMGPREKLKQWRATHKISADTARRLFGCSRSYIYEMERDYTGDNVIPGRTLALRMERETGGAVKASAWDKMARAKFKIKGAA